MPIFQPTISGGAAPTGTINITSNGVTDVTNYASANVQVPTTAPAHYVEKTVDSNGKLINGSNIINLSGTNDIGNYALYGVYRGNTNIPSAVDLSALRSVSGYFGCNSMFYECTGITSVDLSSLTSVSGSYGCRDMFDGCTGITSVDLSSLTDVSGAESCRNMFLGCTGLTSVDLSALTSVSGYWGCYYMFYGCTRLTSLSFPALKTVTGGQAFQNMLGGVTGCTAHFPSNLSSYNFNLGGSNTVLYDLPTTNTLTGADTVTYTRNPKYDTATALAWKVGAYGTTNFTPAYYTSGTTDPQVGDTIYSDTACTTAVTTIDSIA